LGFDNEDAHASGRLTLRVPHDAAKSPHLAFKIDFNNANGDNAVRYYPVHHLSTQTLAWMRSSFGGGRVSQGTVLYDGYIRDFPFSNGEGKFQIRAKVQDAVYRYLPGWEALTNVTADVLIEGDRLLITGQ